VDTLVQGSGEIDVYVISGDRDDSRPVPPARGSGRRSGRPTARPRGGRDLDAIAWAMFPYFAVSNLIMVYLLGVIIVATRYGRGGSLLATS